MADADRDLGAFATYCDDIRIEFNGKSFFIGVYGPFLIAPQFPYTAPKFVVSVKVWMSAQDPVEYVEVKVLYEDEEISTERIDISKQLTDMRADPAYVRDMETATPDLRFAVEQRIVFQPLVLAQAGVLRVKVNTDAGPLKVNSLRVVDQETAKAQGLVLGPTQIA